jgi:hypothetical protein
MAVMIVLACVQNYRRTLVAKQSLDENGPVLMKMSQL